MVETVSQATPYKFCVSIRLLLNMSSVIIQSYLHLEIGYAYNKYLLFRSTLVLWVVTPCGLVKRYIGFLGIYCLDLRCGTI